MMKYLLNYLKTIYYFPLKLWQLLWYTVWNISEFTGIGLGRFAPWVFHQMIGSSHYKKIE